VRLGEKSGDFFVIGIVLGGRRGTTHDVLAVFLINYDRQIVAVDW
jgi:hypothetical protein